MSIEFHDYEIDYSGDPAALDRIVMALGPCALIGVPDYIKSNDHYVLRIFGNPEFIKFACEHQGYCKILCEIPR